MDLRMEQSQATSELAEILDYSPSQQGNASLCPIPQVTVEYDEYPPQDFIAYINRVMAEKAPPHFRVDVQWRQVQPPPVPQQQQQQDLQDDGMYIACDITARFTFRTTYMYIVLQRSRPTRLATDARLWLPCCVETAAVLTASVRRV